MNYTYSARSHDNKNKWWLVDADGMTLGRMASKIASYIRGKHTPLFTPHMDVGDYVVVINAKKIFLSGNKISQKKYYRHSGYIGGIKSIKAKDLMETYPENIIRFAVKGMLPKNKLGKKLIKKLKVYPNDKHPHTAQKLELLVIN